MKRDAYTHPKTLDLASRLDISRAHAIGLLTLLWDFTAAYAPQGDIGRHRNGAIARACDWTGDPDEFVGHLVAAGWVDTCDEHRLRIHDWPEHCENWVRAKVGRLGKSFLPQYNVRSSPNAPQEASYDASYVDSQEGSLEPSSCAPVPSLAKPSLNLAKPSLAKPTPSQHQAQPKPEATDVAVGGSVVGGDLKEVGENECGRQCLRLAKALTRASIRVDADTIWKWAWMALSLDQEGLLAEFITKLHNREIAKPKAYMDAALRRVCNETGRSYASVQSIVPARPRPAEAPS